MRWSGWQEGVDTALAESWPVVGRMWSDATASAAVVGCAKFVRTGADAPPTCTSNPAGRQNEGRPCGQTENNTSTSCCGTSDNFCSYGITDVGSPDSADRIAEASQAQVLSCLQHVLKEQVQTVERILQFHKVRGRKR